MDCGVALDPVECRAMRAILLCFAVLLGLPAGARAQETNAPATTAAPTPSAPPPTDDVDTMLNTIQRQAFLFFWDEASPETGLIRDRASNGIAPSKNKNISSVASVGFGLTAMPVAVERGWIKREEAIARTKATLNFFLKDVESSHGFFFHFVDIKSGKRAWRSELSTIDTALFLAGALFAKEYYQDPEISKLADTLYEQCDFPWAMNGQPFISMGWTPEQGFDSHYWSNYNEGILLTFLAIGSPTHPIDPKTWQKVRRRVGQYKNHILVTCPPLFTHQYPHIWLDLKNKNDGQMDYFKNSTEATLANRDFCIEQSAKYKTYGENSWGLTACDGPFGYKAYGAPPGKPVHDGTIAPTGAATSIMFTPELSIAALKHYYHLNDLPLWGKYGFANSFNRDRKWVDTDVIGIDQGALLLGIENHRTGLIWKHMMKNDAVQRAMKLIGFQSGTIDLKIEPQPKHLVAKAPGLVTIDGDTAEWADVTGIKLDPIVYLEAGAIEGEKDCSGEFKFMWNDKYLYLLMTITDDEVAAGQSRQLIWKDDCIEFFVDPEANGLIWEGKKDFQIGFSPSKTGDDAKTWAWFQKQDPAADQSVILKQKLVPGGYVIEAAISWKYLDIDPKEGLIFGASPALHDRDETVKSEGKLMWYFDDVSGVEGKQLGRFELGR